jgi:hypothetical protein
VWKGKSEIVQFVPKLHFKELKGKSYKMLADFKVRLQITIKELMLSPKVVESTKKVGEV